MRIEGENQRRQNQGATLERTARRGRACPFRMRRFAFVFLGVGPSFSRSTPPVSRQNADDFAQKVAMIPQQGAEYASARARRHAPHRDELNSWFVYRAQPVLPVGVSEPQITIVGEGRLAGQAIIDLDAVAKRRSSGAGAFDPLSLLGGKVPVTVSGILHTRDGKARFEVQRRGDLRRPCADGRPAGTPDLLLAKRRAPAGRAPRRRVLAARQYPSDRSRQGQAVVVQ